MTDFRLYIFIVCVSASLLPARNSARAPVIITRNCSGCHGLDGNSQLDWVPRLAGMQPWYLAHRVTTFRLAARPPVDVPFSRLLHNDHPASVHFTAGERGNMIGISHTISEQQLQQAILWYSAQIPAVGKGGDPRLIQLGKDLYRNGDRLRELPPCQLCHGADAAGTDLAPRIAHQHVPYLANRLAVFRTGDRQASSEMTGVAQHLRDDQAKAVEAYLESR